MNRVLIRLLVVAVAASASRVEAGTMYVVSNFTGSVYRYDAATGQAIPPGGSWPGLFVDSSAGLREPRGVAIGPGGDVFVGSGSQFSDLGQGVYRFNKADGSRMRVIGADKIRFPFGLAFGPDQMLYVNSYNTRTIQRYNPDTGEYLGDFVNTVDPAQSIAFGPDKNLYTTNFVVGNTPWNDGIDQFNGQTGAFMRSFVAPNDRGYYVSAGIAFDPPAPVPEPGAVLLAAIGAIGISMNRRRR